LFEMLKMKGLRKGQIGLTLIELVIVIGLTAAVVGGITMTIMQVLNMNARTRNDMVAVYQVRQAGKLVTEDVLEGQYVTAGGTSGFPLTINWTDWGTNDKHQVVYTLDPPSGGPSILWRKYYLNSTLNSTTKVAEYIDPDQTSCAPPGVLTGGVLTFNVTATVGEQSKTEVYQISPRPGS